MSGWIYPCPFSFSQSFLIVSQYVVVSNSLFLGCVVSFLSLRGFVLLFVKKNTNLQTLCGPPDCICMAPTHSGGCLVVWILLDLCVVLHGGRQSRVGHSRRLVMTMPDVRFTPCARVVCADAFATTRFRDALGRDGRFTIPCRGGDNSSQTPPELPPLPPPQVAVDIAKLIFKAATVATSTHHTACLP